MTVSPHNYQIRDRWVDQRVTLLVICIPMLVGLGPHKTPDMNSILLYQDFWHGAGMLYKRKPV